MPRLTRAQKLTAFLVEHPICCFCGGETPATTEDHIPNRAFFAERNWPEGYIFPACEACNHGTAENEGIVSTIARTGPHSGQAPDVEQVMDRIRSLGTNRPDVVRELLSATAGQKRRSLRRADIEKPSNGLLSEFKMIKPDGPLVSHAIHIYCAKLSLALYYLHTGHIASKSSQVSILWFSNGNWMNEDVPDLFREFPNAVADLERNKRQLSDQFQYSYVNIIDGKGGIFYVMLHNVFSFYGFIVDNDDAVQNAFDVGEGAGRFAFSPSEWPALPDLSILNSFTLSYSYRHVQR